MQARKLLELHDSEERNQGLAAGDEIEGYLSSWDRPYNPAPYASTAPSNLLFILPDSPVAAGSESE